MTSENKTNYALIFTILVTLAGWGVTFGVCQQKIENKRERHIAHRKAARKRPLRL